MIQRLFVYGTLAPGQPNEHVLGDIEGSWETASQIYPAARFISSRASWPTATRRR